MDTTHVSEQYRSEFQFELIGPDARFPDDQFDTINREILIWSLNDAVPCEVVNGPLRAFLSWRAIHWTSASFMAGVCISI